MKLIFLLSYLLTQISCKSLDFTINYDDDNAYHIIKTRQWWDNSYEICSDLNMNLISISNEKIQKSMKHLMLINSLDSVWTSGNNLKSGELIYEWDDTGIFLNSTQYSKWLQNYPSKTTETNYIVISRGNNYQWRNYEGENNYFAVCVCPLNNFHRGMCNGNNKKKLIRDHFNTSEEIIFNYKIQKNNNNIEDCLKEMFNITQSNVTINIMQ